MRVENIEQRVGKFGIIVIQTLLHTACQKSDAFEQSLDMWIVHGVA